MDSTLLQFLKELERQIKDATPGITHAVESFGNSSVMAEVREITEKAKQTAPSALRLFAETMEPYQKIAAQFAERFDELLPYFKIIEHESKVFQTIESLAEHQYVVISRIHPDMVGTVVTDQMIEELLETDEKVRDTIGFIKSHLDNVITFDQSIDAFWTGKYNLAILGFIATLDYFLSKCSKQINNPNFKSRITAIVDKVNAKGDLYLDDLEAADYALCMTYTKAISNIYKGGDFDKAEPPHLSRDWIMHGRTLRKYTRFDCVRLLNMIYGTIRMSEIGESKQMLKFYKTTDGQIVINDSTAGEEIIPNTTEGAYEKHVPVIEHHTDSVLVKVGSVEHPSLPAHYIQWIILETATGYQKVDLKPGDEPIASYNVTEPVVAAYEYCNLHGLWMGKA